MSWRQWHQVMRQRDMSELFPSRHLSGTMITESLLGGVWELSQVICSAGDLEAPLLSALPAPLAGLPAEWPSQAPMPGGWYVDDVDCETWVKLRAWDKPPTATLYRWINQARA